MSLALDRPEFAPPPQRGTPRAVVLALIAHALLIAALTWGVRWKSEGDDDAVEAELWSPTQQVAAPLGLERDVAPDAPAAAHQRDLQRRHQAMRPSPARRVAPGAGSSRLTSARWNSAVPWRARCAANSACSAASRSSRWRPACQAAASGQA